jgi:hypothetical protein
VIKSRDSSVGRVTHYGLDDRMIGIQIPAWAGNFFLRHCVQTGSYSMGTGSFFLGGKAVGAVISFSADVKEYVELYLHSHNKYSWRSA